MTGPFKLAGFGAALALLFGGGALAGELTGADAPGGGEAGRSAAKGHGAAPAARDDGHASEERGGSAAAAHGGGGAAHDAAAGAVRGLAVEQDGLRLALDTPELRRGEPGRLGFRIVDERGATVRDFDVEHTKRMHVIVVRRDLTGFRHLHPRQRPDGGWSVPLTVPDAGSYRVFADFSHDGRPFTLASDLRVDGAAELAGLPAPRREAVSDGGLRVRLDAGAVRAGAPATLRFRATQDGRPVPVEPYLGAGGHLVALREGDLAFLHVHPTEDGHGGAAAGDAVGFEATFPSEGRYRLFLQLKVAGRVHTAAFTVEASR